MKNLKFVVRNREIEEEFEEFETLEEAKNILKYLKIKTKKMEYMKITTTKYMTEIQKK